jgi:hypothetical protein
VVKVEVLGGVKFLGPVVYNQEGMQWHGHILYITPGGGGETKSFLKPRKKTCGFPKTLKPLLILYSQQLSARQN